MKSPHKNQTKPTLRRCVACYCFSFFFSARQTKEKAGPLHSITSFVCHASMHWSPPSIQSQLPDAFPLPLNRIRKGSGARPHPHHNRHAGLIINSKSCSPILVNKTHTHNYSETKRSSLDLLLLYSLLVSIRLLSPTISIPHGRALPSHKAHST